MYEIQLSKKYLNRNFKKKKKIIIVDDLIGINNKQISNRMYFM